MSNIWQVQDAKARFSGGVLETSDRLTEGPQIVTRGGVWRLRCWFPLNSGSRLEPGGLQHPASTAVWEVSSTARVSTRSALAQVTSVCCSAAAAAGWRATSGVAYTEASGLAAVEQIAHGRS